MRRRAASGFTLIELLVVIAIIGILAGIAAGRFTHHIQKSKEAVLRENLYIMRQAINNYFADKGKWPADLETLVEDRYITKVPVDPITQASDSWVTESSAGDESDISEEPGIVDVKSGAEGVGLDGTSYSEW